MEQHDSAVERGRDRLGDNHAEKWQAANVYFRQTVRSQSAEASIIQKINDEELTGPQPQESDEEELTDK